MPVLTTQTERLRSSLQAKIESVFHFEETEPTPLLITEANEPFPDDVQAAVRKQFAGWRPRPEKPVSDWWTVFDAFREVPNPEPSNHAAELLTPGRVVVWAACPLCGVRMPIGVYLQPELLVDDTGRALKVKAKSKASTHSCGQLVVGAPEDVPADVDEEPTNDEEPENPAPVVVEGQEPLDLDGALESKAVEMPFPPGKHKLCDHMLGVVQCDRSAGHTGQHHYQVEDEAGAARS